MHLSFCAIAVSTITLITAAKPSCSYLSRTAVEDSGPGIDPDKLDGIFRAFFTTKSHGMGLGLAICRMIVERHGGKLTAASDGKTGARFQFVLPIGPQAQGATAEAPAAGA